ncbi:bifunctional phosphopantothenoylcysteine decarboxylase/phosphopantothenate--cysteine ligase CoaBC [Lactobacillus sp. PSON]|uniref:bifunctional phosphopantothenoylcysteine decarboxylase/phosphopantothenate--cysteine ligase CoaBC n=1 Tax=Lactobacillus sp. PSON TaxID=3455454 RepID=UPI0040433623
MVNITTYITGGIAAYKAAIVVRNLEKMGHKVRVVMTENAKKFVTSQTFAALTKYPVLDDLWLKSNEAEIPHVHLAKWTELAIVVPASADFIAKMANGIANDAASTTILATSAPKIVIPAMNDNMWENPATKRNISLLMKDGVKVMPPVTGMLAEGYSAKGRMPDPEEIVKYVHDFLQNRQNLVNKKIVITAGGTIEAIDPVRYIGNNSSGKMGIALARAAADAGADVSLIYGNISVELPEDNNIHKIQVTSSEDMLEKVQEEFKSADALIMAAAVADWRMKEVADHKLKKQANQNELQLTLVKTPDILKAVSTQKKDNKIIIGFAAETNNLLENANRKLEEKGADYIVANDVSKDVFGNDEDQVTILQKNAKNQVWPRMSKQKIAQKIIDLLSNQL